MNGERATRGFRPPRQRRSRDTVERIVGATEGLLAERGVEGVTVHEIVRRADSSVGSFYARFEDRDAAVRYVHGRFWAEAAARWDAYLEASRWEGKSAIAIIARVIRALVRAMMADRDRLRPFLLLALSDPDGRLLERTASLDGRIASGMAELLTERTATLPQDIPDPVLREGFVRVLGAIRDAVVFGDGSEEASRNLALSLVRMYGASIGLGGLPESWSELLALCKDRPGSR